MKKKYFYSEQDLRAVGFSSATIEAIREQWAKVEERQKAKENHMPKQCDNLMCEDCEFHITDTFCEAKDVYVGDNTPACNFYKQADERGEYDR